MRKYAYLKQPFRNASGNPVIKIMVYESEEGIFLFAYDRADAQMCCFDYQYESLKDLYEEWNERIDQRGWTGIEDPLDGCQHDAFLPIRIKGRDIGKPEWGTWEILENGKWVEYKPKRKSAES